MRYIKFIIILIITPLFFSLCNDNSETDLTPTDNEKNDTLYSDVLRPFPQHTNYFNNVIIPNINQETMDQEVISFYKSWKNIYIKSLNKEQKYVHYTKEQSVGDAISCSEGHGFGMLITVLMAGADTLAFDTYIKLYNFNKAHPSSINNKLMAWQQDSDGNNSSGADSATDGDLDIALSLLLASIQWGDYDDIDFQAEAIAMIDAILESDISSDYKTIELGDWVSSSSKYYKGTRCCDFMLDHLRAFSKFSHETNFLEVIDTVYNVINSVSHETTGLLPDFVMIENNNYIPCPPHYLEGPNDGNYYYNSCRAPWRIAMDYIVYGDDRALTSLNRLNNWIKASTNGDAGSICGGYKLDGTPLNSWSDMAFTAPFGVSAMVDKSHQEWLNEMWNEITQTPISSESYFGNSIKMLCLITMSGNWWTI